MKRHRGVRLRLGKMYLSFLAALLICALMLHGAYLVQSWGSLVRQARAEREQVLAQKVYHTERYVKEMEDCANVLCVSTRLQQVLINRQTPDYLAYADCRDLLTEYEFAPYDIFRIDLYLSSSQSLITSSEGVFYHLGEEERAVYEALMARGKGEGDCFWTLDYQTHEPELVAKTRGIRYITLVKRVVSLYTGKSKGILLISVPYEHFASINAETPENEYSCIRFGGETLCGASAEGEGWETLVMAAEEAPGFTLEYSYRFGFWSVFGGGFVVVLGVIMLLFLLGFVLIVIITERRVAKPVERLLQGFARLEAGDFSTRVGDGEDGIFGELNRGFDHMAEHLQSTVTELVDEKTRGRELKQRLLMMQIKPHFLYNIFNNMIWLVEQGQYDNLKELVGATAGFYKTALNAGSEDIMLFDNQRQLAYYVCIQKFRFGDRFDLEMEVSEEAETLTIPNLLLQPLVENAIAHGFQGLEGRGLIRVTAQVTDGTLTVRVRDNGCGIEPERLADIRRAMAQDAGGEKYFALVNVAARLRSRYGGEASIGISSRPGEGTEVVIRMPAGA
ncbi:MAG: sensor histidine kinase [Aristaeellaceae bacterium]